MGHHGHRSPQKTEERRIEYLKKFNLIDFAQRNYRVANLHKSRGYIGGTSLKETFRLRVGKCEVCGSNATEELQVHHKDKNRRNNQISNLSILCLNCHRQMHKDGFVIFGGMSGDA